MYDIENALRRRAMLERLEARDRADAATTAAAVTGEAGPGLSAPDPGRVEPATGPTVPPPSAAQAAPVVPLGSPLPATTTIAVTSNGSAPQAIEAGPRPGGAYEAPSRTAYRNGADTRQAPRSATPQVYDRPSVATPGSPSSPGNGDGMSPLHDDMTRRYRSGPDTRDPDATISSVRTPTEPQTPAGGAMPEVDDDALAVHLAAWQAITGLTPQGGTEATPPTVPAVPAVPPGQVPPHRTSTVPPASGSPVPPGAAVPPSAEDDDETSTAATIADLLRQGGGGLFFRPGAVDRRPED